jgi:DNA modification methylase
MASREIPALARAWEASGGQVLRWAYWVKSSFTLGRGDYHHQHEPILFGCRAGSTFKTDREVWEFPKPSVNELHPTQKPVDMIRALMDESTKPGELVLEPFAGSGTTLAVAQASGRVCYASEIDPRFVDVIRKRGAEQIHGQGCDWQKLTPGKKA